jgi:hypothetical protein
VDNHSPYSRSGSSIDKIPPRQSFFLHSILPFSIIPDIPIPNDSVSTTGPDKSPIASSPQIDTEARLAKSKMFSNGVA